MPKTIRLHLILFAVAAAVAARADQTPLGEIPFRQALLDMGTDLRLMCIAAHPDDEDDATLALYRLGYGLKTFAVIATRGEGGQNEIGPELYADLAVIRTREMAAASEVIGAELRFLDMPEFGFSKSAEETFAIWGHEELLRRLVRVIRQDRPDVLITNHDTRTGHGHHRAVGITLIEAFDAAADPTRFPEQLQEGLEPWQPARLYVRTWEPTPESIPVDINAYNPLRGKTYAEIAADALQQHKSQGMQSFIDRYLNGTASAHYILIRESAQRADTLTDVDAPGGEGAVLVRGLKDRVVRFNDRLFAQNAGLYAPEIMGSSGGDLLWARIGTGEVVGRSLLAPYLLDYAGQLHAGRGESPNAQRRWQRANDAAILAADLQLEASLDDLEAVPGQTVAVAAALKTHRLTAARVDLGVAPVSWFPATGSGPIGTAGATLDVSLSPAAPLTLPTAEWLTKSHSTAPQLAVSARVALQPRPDAESVPLELTLPLRVEVAPPTEVRFAKDRYLVRHGVDSELPVDLVVTDHTEGADTPTVVVTASKSLVLPGERFAVELGGEGQQRVVPVRAKLAEGTLPGDLHLSALVAGTGRVAHTVARVVDVKVPENIRVGVVQSYDDTLVDTLDQLAVPHKALALEDFAPETLDTFTTILVDIRAYLVRPDLVANNRALLDYVHRGGTVVVMYQKTFEWKPEFAPYPLRISTNRVTREDAPVQALAPDHSFFRAPNIITAQDWEGWIQERGLYFADQWDPAYTPLIATTDPDEDIPPGSLLAAQYGEGTYVYTALVWYRQLRDLNPGALRLFANLLGKSRG